MHAFAPLFVVVAAVPALAGPHIQDVQVNARAGGVDVVIVASEPLTFQSWLQANPATVVVDLIDVAGEARSLAGVGQVKTVEITRHDSRGAALTRLSLPLLTAQEHTVSARGNTIVVSVFDAGLGPVGTGAAQPKLTGQATLRPDSLAPVLVASFDPGMVEGEMGRATATDAVSPRYAQAKGARTMTYIGFQNSATQSRVFARLNDEAEFKVRKEGANLIVLEIKNATIPLRNNKNHLDTTFFDSPVKMITPSEIEDASPTVRITIEMKTAVPFETKVEGREIAIYFKK